ncbi:hypothetical protein [Cytophaga hutchinsonii]|uniref:DNA-directed DNA polymerase family A palm domain-containing protein n=1 Tax=Cytophaga hutchinsonii (strain ATCC 33406 / DSM 1761 / CIP 103989 / NBRC 15051 / NCIMB 9469 / D465) TaxID=269798 RepID=A0A6N4SM68_CYTH3|nr:hypothetical protein [Cytophaga hutchinsonii]ABG57343.1 conserved hypothetical protein [Cytophaga hutchinsonii ATCC 33406]SFX46771.1 hypothetical protein SAMN04487930_104241 [Cytophaga hutchinsonii ATCC 33406]
MKKAVYFYIPSSLCSFPMVLTSIGREEMISHHIDKFLYIIHELYVSRFLDKSLGKDSFIPLSSKMLRKILGKRYVKPILNILTTELGIIECDGIYHHHTGKNKGNGKCYGYRLTEKYRNEIFRQIMSDDTKFSNKMRLNYYSTKDKLLTHLYNLLFKLELDIVNQVLTSKSKIASSYDISLIDTSCWDFSYPEYILSDDLSSLVIYYPTPYCSNYYYPSTVYSYVDTANIEFKKCSVYKYTRSSSYFLSSSTSSYLYSYVGTALSQVEKNLSLYQIDLTDKEEIKYTWNQFKSDMLSIQKIEQQDYFFKERETRIFHNISSLRKEIKKGLMVNGKLLKESDIKNSQPLLFAIVLMQELRDKGIDIDSSPDVSSYINLCEEGMIYDYLMLKMNLDPKNEDLRKTFKTDFFHYIFYCKIPRGWMIRKTPLLQLFVSEFPNVYSILCDIKKENHATLAKRMQILETDIITRRVLGILTEKYPKEVFVSIHDSILSSEDLQKEVQATIISEINKEGVNVALSGNTSETSAISIY